MTPEQVVDKQLEYYNSHLLEEFCSTYTKDIEIYNHQTGELLIDGQDQLRERYRQRFLTDGLHAKIINRIVLGNTVIDKEEVAGIKEGGFVYAVAIYEIEDGLIKKVSFVY